MGKILSSGRRACLPSTPCPPGPGAATTTLSWLAFRSDDSTCSPLTILVVSCGFCICNSWFRMDWLGWIGFDSDLQAFVEAGGEADLDVYRAVLRFPKNFCTIICVIPTLLSLPFQFPSQIWMIPPICVQTHICIHSNQSKLKHQELALETNLTWMAKSFCVSAVNNFPFFQLYIYKHNLVFLLTRKTFGEGTAWQEALSRRKEAYTPAKRREKRFTPSMKMTRGMLVMRVSFLLSSSFIF